MNVGMLSDATRLLGANAYRTFGSRAAGAGAGWSGAGVKLLLQ